jgi:hypothetical protein
MRPETRLVARHEGEEFADSGHDCVHVEINVVAAPINKASTIFQ